MIRTIDYLNKWVAQRKSFSFFLPDGPEGRPFDNQYYVQSIQDNNDTLVIRLTPDIELIFDGETQYRDDVCNLILFDFDRLRYVVAGKLKKEYLDGEFCLNGF